MKLTVAAYTLTCALVVLGLAFAHLYGRSLAIRPHQSLIQALEGDN